MFLWEFLFVSLATCLPPNVVDPEMHWEWLCGLMGLFMHSPLKQLLAFLTWDNSLSGVLLPHTASTDCHCNFLQPLLLRLRELSLWKGLLPQSRLGRQTPTSSISSCYQFKGSFLSPSSQRKGFYACKM